MTDRVYSMPKVAIEPNDEWVSGWIYFSFIGDDRPYWLKHLRIYEWAPRLMDHEALDVLADALEAGNRASVDEVIKDSGITGCWRPSTILVQRFTDYANNRMPIDASTVAHALWNVDLHVLAQRHFSFGLELANDETRLRHVRVSMILTELTDEELRPEDQDTNLEQRFRMQDRRIASLEKTVKVLGQVARRTAGPLLDLEIKRVRDGE